MILTLVPAPRPKRCPKRWATTLSAGVVERARRTCTTAARCERAKRHARRMGGRPTRREEIAEAAVVRAQSRAAAAHRHVPGCARCAYALHMACHLEAYWLALQDALRASRRDGVVALAGFGRGRELRANADEILRQTIAGDLRPLRRGDGEREPVWIATPRR